jgi:fibro-slime domain-containing protein
MIRLLSTAVLTRAASSALACVALLGLSEAALAQTPPEVIRLTGTVRDFRRAHLDFDVVPSVGYGHYAMNVAFELPLDERPVLRKGGFAVDVQWTDKASRPIAPHLYAGGAGVVKLATAPVVAPLATVDTWDSEAGPYGGDNVGPAPTFYVGATMPTLSEPTGMGPSVGIVSYDSNGTSTLASDVHCNEMRITDGHTLRISNDVTILCEQVFEMRDDADIELMPGGSLTLYTKGTVSFKDSAVNANTYDPSRFVIYHLGATAILIADQAQVYATIVAPDGGMAIPDDSDFYGNFTGRGLAVADAAGFHIDTRMPEDACGVKLNDTRGIAGFTSTGGITSADTFSQWYRNIMGTNLAMSKTISLRRNEMGVYEYLSDAFHPIDGLMYGNEGEAHNNYFTFTFEAGFVYDQCVGQFMEFEGNDDVWVFVNGELAMDIGGVLPGTGQYLDLDRLGLEDGAYCELHFFHANRNPLESVFRLRTNIQLDGSGLKMITASFD